MPSPFTHIATYRGVCGVLNTLAGPGPDGPHGPQRLYQSHIYIGSTLELVSIDPHTGHHEVYPSPVPTESGAWAMALGPASDGCLYLGTLPNAHVLRFDPRARTLTDAGRPSETEQYIWQLALGPDGNLYGSTILPLRFFRVLVESKDRAPGSGPLPPGPGAPPVILSEARDQPRTSTPVPPGGPDASVILSEAKDRSRGSSSLPPGSDAPPVILSEAKNPSPPSNPLTELGRLGGGEFYSFLTLGNHLLCAAYAGDAPLMVYDPSGPFAPGNTPPANPLFVHYEGHVTSWRPMAMIFGPPSGDGQPPSTVYLGAVAGYGELGGPLTVWDTATHHVQFYPHLIPDQSVVSLALLDTPVGPLLAGGTAIRGGGGSYPTQKDATLFLWDPRTRTLLFHTVPVPGASEITDLVTVPPSPDSPDHPAGLLYGIATGAGGGSGGGGGHTLFAFDPAARRVTLTHPLPFQGLIYNAAALAPDGRIWGLAQDGIFTVDPGTAHVQLVARTPDRITAGFALDPASRHLYLASGAHIYRYAVASS